MTWSNATEIEPALDKFTGKPVVEIATRATQDSSLPQSRPDYSPAAGMQVPIDDPKAPSVAPNPIPMPPVYRPVVERSREEVCATLAEAARSNDLPVPFFIRLLFQESGFRPEIVSSAGAQGIAQFMPETAADEGLANPFDPVQAIPASARLLRKLIAQFGNLGLAAAAYNAGPQRIRDWLDKKGELPHETQGYVKIITGQPADNWRAAKAKDAAHTLPERAPCKEAVPAPVVTASADKDKNKTDDAKASKTKATRVASADKTDGKAEKKAKTDKPEKSAKADKPDKVAKGVNPAKSTKSETSAKAPKPAKTAAAGKPKTPTEQLAARKHKNAKGTAGKSAKDAKREASKVAQK